MEKRAYFQQQAKLVGDRKTRAGQDAVSSPGQNEPQQLLGGFSTEKYPDSELENMLMKDYKDLIEKQAGKKFKVFKPIKYTVQVVAGTIYKCLYEIDDNKYLIAKVF